MNYADAIDFINNLPRTGPQVFKGRAGLERAKQFFVLLNNPQEKLKVIHIAGTSGKGSVAMLTSSILDAHGFKVGMTLSPHVYDIRERLQLNNNLIAKTDFVRLLLIIMPAITAMSDNNKAVTYFEVLLAMALVYFAEQKVDYAVVETGVGGLYDGTNTVSRTDKLAVITRIGKDHVQLLGSSISDIAKQKVGIINPGNYVIALCQAATVNKIIKQCANASKSSVEWVETEQNQAVAITTLPENINLAQAITKHLSARDVWELNTAVSNAAISRTVLPGRFEIIKKNHKTYILDGAHNQQKLNALIAMAKIKLPNQSIGIILAMKSSKDIPKLNGVKEAICTVFHSEGQDMPVPAADPSKLASNLKRLSPDLTTRPANSFAQALKIVQSSEIRIWLVTGSFLLLAEAKQQIK